MSKLGSRMVQFAKEALAYAQGKTSKGFVVHKPVDVKALRERLNLNVTCFETGISSRLDRSRCFQSAY